MYRPVVFSDPLLHHLKQFFRVVDNPSVFQHLAGMEAGDGKRGGDGDDVHPSSDPGPNPIGRVLEHQTLLGWNLKFLSSQLVYLGVRLGPLHIFA